MFYVVDKLECFIPNFSSLVLSQISARVHTTSSQKMILASTRIRVLEYIAFFIYLGVSISRNLSELVNWNVALALVHIQESL